MEMTLFVFFLQMISFSFCCFKFQFDDWLGEVFFFSNTYDNFIFLSYDIMMFF